MTYVKWSMVVYGLALIGMGIQAFFFPTDGGHASPISLLAAGGSGALVLFLTWLSFKYPRAAYIITILVALLIAGRFLGGMSKGLAFYPAIVSIVLSVALIGILLSGHLMAMAQKKKQEA